MDQAVTPRTQRTQSNSFFLLVISLCNQAQLRQGNACTPLLRYYNTTLKHRERSQTFLCHVFIKTSRLYVSNTSLVLGKRLPVSDFLSAIFLQPNRLDRNESATVSG